jgi:hypothetical protein
MVTRTPLNVPQHVQRVSLFLQTENRLNISIVTVRLSVLRSYDFCYGEGMCFKPRLGDRLFEGCNDLC